MRKIPKSIWAVLAIAVIAVAGYFLFRDDKKEGPQYRFDVVDRGDILVAISATGTLNAVTTVQVGSQVSGTIAKLYADYNTEVTEGQVIAQIDPTFLQASVNEQKANVERAAAQVNEAKRNLDRTIPLAEKKLVSQADLDAATTAYESAVAGQKQAQAALDRAQVNLRYATIKAPISGVVISRQVDVGQTVAASLQAPQLFTIANDLTKMQVTASVDEADIGNVKTSQPVSFQVDAFPEEQFMGTVSQVRLSPVITQNVVTYQVIIDVDNPEQKLMPGMTANLSIEVAKRENVLRVPLMATRFIPANQPAQSGEERRQGKSQVQAADRTQAGPDSTRQDSTGALDTMRRPAENGGGGKPGGNGMRGARVWTMEAGQLVPHRFERGLQNQRYVEMLNSDLNPGDSVVVGTLSAQTQTAAPQGQSPFMPRMPGGGSRQGGGSRGR